MQSTLASRARPVWQRLAAGRYRVGIDIGQVTTKVVLAELQPGGAVVYRGACLPSRASAARIPLDPREATSAEELGDPANTTPNAQLRWSRHELRCLMSRVRQVIPCRLPEVSVTLSMSACDYRTLYIPKSSAAQPANVAQSIASVLGDQRPRCIALIASDEVGSDKRPATLRCFSVTQDLACDVAGNLADVGLMPKIINGLPWCMANALDMITPPAAEDQLTVGLDWSYGPPTLVAVRGGRIDYVRCLASGSLRELLAPAASRLGLTPAEAGHWLAGQLERAPCPEDHPLASECCEWVRECCTRLAAELELALEFIQWRNQGRKVDQTVLIGGATRVAGLPGLLQGLLNCPLQIWSLQGGSQLLDANYALAASLVWRGNDHV